MDPNLQGDEVFHFEMTKGKDGDVIMVWTLDLRSGRVSLRRESGKWVRERRDPDAVTITVTDDFVTDFLDQSTSKSAIQKSALAEKSHTFVLDEYNRAHTNKGRMDIHPWDGCVERVQKLGIMAGAVQTALSYLRDQSEKDAERDKKEAALHTIAVKAQLDKNPASAEACDTDGNTALHKAMDKGYPPGAIDAIFGRYPDAARVKSADSRYPLHLAMASCTHNDAIIKILRAYPQAANSKDGNGFMPIAYGTKGPDPMSPLPEPPQPPYVIRSVLQAQSESNFDCKDLEPYFFEHDGFVRLRDLLDVCEESIVGEHAKLTSAELCQGWTALNIAIGLNSEAAFTWLLSEHSKDPSFVHGDGEQLKRRAVEAAIASHDPVIRKWGNGYGRLLNRFRVASGDPVHVSRTCVVVFATELKIHAEGGIEIEVEHGVALKFLKDEAAYERELKNRQLIEKLGGDGRRLVISVEYHTSDLTPEDLAPFKGIGLIDEDEKDGNKLDQSNLKYMLVLARGSADLSDIISHRNVAGTNLHLALDIAISVAECLQYLNEKCNVMHGDVKSRNFVDTGFNYAAIDLDAAAQIGAAGEAGLAGRKKTSSGYLPPEQAAVVLNESRAVAKPSRRKSMHKRRRSSHVTVTSEISRIREEMSDPSKSADDIEMLLDQLREKQAELNVLSQHTPESIKASASYDMWGFGVMLYQLFTGRALFDMDVREDVERAELRRIATWHDSHKHRKLKAVKSKWPKVLLEKLLSKDPNDRPHSWFEVIHELKAFSSGDVKLKRMIQQFHRENQKHHQDNADNWEAINFERNAMHTELLAELKSGFDLTRKFVADLHNTAYPFVYDVVLIDPREAAVTNTAITSAKKAAAEESDLSAGFMERLNNARDFMTNVTETTVCAATAKVGKNGSPTYKLRLRCGVTFKVVVEYDIQEAAYSQIKKRLANVGVAVAAGVIKIGAVWNPVGKVARLFGYPIPDIPIELVKRGKDFLESLSDSSIDIAALKAQSKSNEGMGIAELVEFGDLLEKLEKRTNVAWSDYLFAWPDANSGLVTFVSDDAYPRHGGDTNQNHSDDESCDESDESDGDAKGTHEAANGDVQSALTAMAAFDLMRAASNERWKQAEEQQRKIAEQASKRDKELLAAMQCGFYNTRKFIADFKNVTCPFLFEILSESQIEQEVAAAAKEREMPIFAKPARIGTADRAPFKPIHPMIQSFKARLSNARRCFNRANDCIQQAMTSASLDIVLASLAAAKVDRTYVLRLLCGVTFEPVVEYKITTKKDRGMVKKLSFTASILARKLIRLGAVLNPRSVESQCVFGVETKDVPSEYATEAATFLHALEDERIDREWDDLMQLRSGKDGLGIQQLKEFEKLLNKLSSEKGAQDWRSVLFKWTDPQHPDLVTFVSAKVYPKHKTEDGVVSEDQPTPTKQKKIPPDSSRTQSTLCSIQ